MDETKIVKRLVPLLLVLILLAINGRVCVAETPIDALIIAPHPDDEALMGAGIIYRYLKQKKKFG